MANPCVHVHCGHMLWCGAKVAIVMLSWLPPKLTERKAAQDIMTRDMPEPQRSLLGIVGSVSCTGWCRNVHGLLLPL